MAESRGASLQVDPDGTITACDEQARRWFGDCAGKRVEDLFEGASSGTIAPPGQATAITAAGPLAVIVEVRAAEGGLDVRVHDDTARRNRDARIEHNERQLNEAQAAAGVGSWEWDIIADKITWTDELFRIYGLEPQSFEATYEAYVERIHPDDKEMAQGVVQKAFETGEPFSFDHRIVRADDGSTRLLHGQGAVEMEGGKPARMYGVSQDITEMREAETARAHAQQQRAKIEHLKRLDRERRRLLNTLAHELKTPLTPLSIQLQLLQGGRLGALSQEQQRSTHILDQNVTRLRALVGDILDSARLDEGKLRLQPIAQDLISLVRSAHETFAPQAAGQDVTLRYRGPDELDCPVDADRITQVMFNLLSNALKFTPKGGRIDVDVETDGPSACIRVTDSGSGLSPKQIDQLFHPFTQVHEESQRTDGTGLGLHICKGIVEQHGGTIACRSDGPGKGTTFEIRLPRQQKAVTTTA